MEYKKICNKSYLSILARGKINDNTTIDDFIVKLSEEFQEVKDARMELLMAKTSTEKLKAREHFAEEITDLKTVCINMLIFCGYDPESELLKVIDKNENRDD